MFEILKKYKEKIISISLCLLILTALGLWAVRMGEGHVSEDELDAQLSENDKDGTIYVYVGGEVKNKGAYYLKEGARVGDAIEAAGGFTDNANKKINIAFLLEDGSRVIVANKSEEANSGIDFKVNINTATVRELCQLDGVGEKTAEKIIEYRESAGGFAAPEDIIKVKGIGESLYDKIKSIIVTE